MFLAGFPYNIVIPIIGAVLLVGIVFGVFYYVKKKEGHVKVDEEFIDNLLKYFGDKENIEAIEVEQARLKIKVYDLDLVDLESVKTVSQNGVFVTGTTVKTLFKYESTQIAAWLKKVL